MEEKPAEVISNYTGIAISNDDKEIYLGLPISLNATVFPYDIFVWLLINTREEFLNKTNVNNNSQYTMFNLI